jgi:hypothetical protein
MSDEQDALEALEREASDFTKVSIISHLDMTSLTADARRMLKLTAFEKHLF